MTAPMPMNSCGTPMRPCTRLNRRGATAHSSSVPK
jgi:hypothetical protein